MKTLQRWIWRTLATKKIPHSRPRRTRLNLEVLEERLAPTVCPTVSINGPANNSFTNNNEPTLTATASDIGGPGLANVQFQYSTNGGNTWLAAGNPVPGSGPTFSYTFTSPLADGTYAVRAIATDNAGNSAISSDSLSTLASFNGTNGHGPYGGLVEDSSGDLFGTTVDGGAYGSEYGGYGTVFEIVHGSGLVTALVSFNGTNGANSWGNLVEDSSGDLFGTTENGGATWTGANLSGDGTVFEIAHGSSAITTLASFNGTNGANPRGSLVADSSGDLFGITEGGGAYEAQYGGLGTVFEIAHGSSAITTLASFNGTNGNGPEGSLVEDSSGNLFGTTSGGGNFGYGAVFELAAGSNSITALASFNNTGEYGEYSPVGVVEDSSGDLFGTTQYGGTFGDGTVFEIRQGSSVVTVLASFNGTNGDSPQSGVIEDSSGDLFGATNEGGASDYGTVFAIAAGNSAITTLTSFNGSNGEYALAGLIEDSSGNLFGTTGGGTDGTVFELSGPPISFTIDTTPPTVRITNQPPALSVSTSASFSYTGSDPISGVSYFQYQLDNSGYQTATNPVDLTGLSIGSHTFQVEAVDNAGNVSTPASYTWTINNFPPAVTNVVINGDANSVEINSASESGNTVTITTRGEQPFTVGEEIEIAGVAANGNLFNDYNGIFAVNSVLDNHDFTFIDGTSGLPNASNENAPNNPDGGASEGQTISTITQSGSTVTVTFASPHGFTIGDEITITGSINSYNATWPITSVPTPTTLTFIDTKIAGNARGGTAFNALIGSQRSEVTNIVYTFSEPVTLNASTAFSIVADSNTGSAPAGVAPTLTWTAIDGTTNANTQWVVTFNGAGTTGGNHGANSVVLIANGVYNITLNASGVTAASDGQNLAASETDTFYRLFGDAYGDERVNVADAGAFSSAYNFKNTAAAYLAYFDFNNDGLIAVYDSGWFSTYYNLKYKGFTATI